MSFNSEERHIIDYRFSDYQRAFTWMGGRVRFIAPVLKTGNRLLGSWVQILPHPLSRYYKFIVVKKRGSLCLEVIQIIAQIGILAAIAMNLCR